MPAVVALPGCMADDPTHFLDATDQAALVARRALSARELTEGAIRRIEALNPSLNALASTRFDKALDEADAIDRSPMEARGPLAGVPLLVKDLEAVAGEPMTLGCRLFEGFVPPRDDRWVARLRRAGAIPLGKTTTPEFGLVNTTESALLGPTHNPWRRDLSPGGSSGGSAVAIASGMVSLATASDGGGSIRIPACANGIFGLKPSRGRGIMPSQNLPGDLAVTFAYGRSVRDTARLLELSDAGRVAWKGEAGLPAIGFVEPGHLPALRVAVILPSLFGAAPEPSVAGAVAEVGGLLERLGHHVETAVYPIDGGLLADHFTKVWASVPDRLRRNFWALRLIARGPRPWAWPSWQDAFEPFTRAMADLFREEERAQPGQVARALAYQQRAEADWAAFFETYDVVLSPVLRRPWFGLGEIDTSLPLDILRERLLDNAGYTPLQNFTGLPAMSLPLGMSADGLPIGVQITGPYLHEERLLKLAYQLEEASPWAGRRPADPPA